MYIHATREAKLSDLHDRLVEGNNVINYLVNRSLLPIEAVGGFSLVDTRLSIRLRTDKLKDFQFHAITSELMAKDSKWKPENKSQRIEINFTDNLDFELRDLVGKSKINAQVLMAGIIKKSEFVVGITSALDLFLDDLLKTGIMFGTSNRKDVSVRKLLTDWEGEDGRVNALEFLKEAGLGSKFDYISNGSASRILTSLRFLLLERNSERFYDLRTDPDFRESIRKHEIAYISENIINSLTYQCEYAEENGIYFDVNGNIVKRGEI